MSNPYNVPFSVFKEKTGIYNLTPYLKNKKSQNKNGRDEELAFEDFTIDTTLVKQMSLDKDRVSFSFKINLIESNVEGETYNLFIRQIDNQWLSSIFLFVDDNDFTNDKLFNSIEEVYSFDGIYNYQTSNSSSRSSWAETTNYHCTNSGSCTSGICDLCHKCVSTSTTFVAFTTNGENPNDYGGGGTDGGMYNGGGGGAGGTLSNNDNDDCPIPTGDLMNQMIVTFGSGNFEIDCDTDINNLPYFNSVVAANNFIDSLMNNNFINESSVMDDDVTSSIRRDVHKMEISSLPQADLVASIKVKVPDDNNDLECLEILTTRIDLEGNTSLFDWTQLDGEDATDVINGPLVQVSEADDAIRIEIQGELLTGLNISGNILKIRSLITVKLFYN